MSLVEDLRSAPPVRWGILGPGRIAHRFAREARQHTAQVLTAVGSRSAPRAETFAQEFSIERAYGDYEALVADPEVDAIYIATPHSHHRETALLAISAGKHVLIEKPLTRNAHEAREVFAAARAAGVFVMEAMWTAFLPHMLELRAVVDRGEIGRVVGLAADHGQMLNFGPTHRLLNPELAGGAILDLGVYPISFAHHVLGQPETITAVGALTETEVDGHASIVLSYASDAYAVLDTTLWAATPCIAWIAGEQGRIVLDRQFYHPTQFHMARADGTTWTYDGRVAGGFQFEIAEAARQVAAGATESPLRSWQATLDVMEIMDSARAQLGVVYPGE
jgi:predicted dehydrogenase